jgi:uncharacterized peroxidase-related enzyme
MAKFPKLGEDAAVLDLFNMSPAAGAPLLHLHEAIMRGPSPLSEGVRELISAYVCGVAGGRYCHGVHAETAKAYDDIPDAAVDAMFDDLEGAGFPPKIVPLLRMAGKLTKDPQSFTEADAQAVYDAGWDEQALHDAIMVVCCFNFMSRLLEGHGVEGRGALFTERGRRLKDEGYLPLLSQLAPEGGKAE